MQLLLIFTFQTYNLFVISVFLPLSFFKGSLTLMRDVLRSRLESSDVAHMELSQASLLHHCCAHDSPSDFVFCPVVVPAAVSCDLAHRERLFSSHWKLLHHLVTVITVSVPCCCDMTAILVVSLQAVPTVEHIDICCYLVITGWTTGQAGTIVLLTPCCLFSWSEHHHQQFWSVHRCDTAQLCFYLTKFEWVLQQNTHTQKQSYN